ncbi:MAG: hypothetical protein E7645_01035 [Ruminococcaceae bacterium]|nr:hypothetical protein [Oscillospiraceae bacterium]
MKKIFILLVSALLLAGVLVACTGGGEETPTEAPHKHTFATEWSYDEDGHWYAANCGHEMQANVGTHADEDNDGICDICLWDHDHEHTFKEEWAWDQTDHWHNSDCGHSVEEGKASHADANNDSICDGCGWNYDHEHTYAKEWSHDADNHWHAPDCGHDVEPNGEAPHEDGNNDGICDGCAWNYDHTHTYAETWSHDAENHWKAPTCTHTVTAELSPHADEDNDGICDGCGWNYDHDHTYDAGDKWTINDTHHWHAPTCGHDVAGIDKAAHVDADSNEECDVCRYDYNHEHTYDTETWVWDKKVHYHASTCGHAVRANEEAHKDVDNDGICDVCTWNYDHTHEFSSDWSHDKTNHWHPATCTHNVKDGVEPHADANNDGICDVCAWNYDHTHTFDTSAWVIGTDTHYHAPTCGHNPQYVRGDEVNHEDKNRDDKCDICGGYVSMEVVVDNAASADVVTQIKGGTIEMIFTGSNYQGDVTYEFGDGYLYIKDHHTFSNILNDMVYSTENNFEYWYHQNDDGSIFAIQKEGGDPFRNMGAEAAFMKGYYFSGEFISYAFNCYGVEELLYQLYGMHLSADFTCADYQEFYDQKTDTYSFSFVYGGEVNVSFKINESGALTYLKLVTSESEIVINQTVGKRTATNPYDPDVILINSYDIVDVNGNSVKDGDVIPMITGSDYKLDLQVVNMLPTTANSAFDRVHISCNDESAVITYAGTDGNMIINAQKEGTYTITFTTEKQTKSITIVAVYPAPTSIMTQIFDANGGYSTYSEYTMYIGEVMHFIAAVASGTDARYTAAITQNMTNATLEDTTIEVLREPVAVTAFKPNQLGDYEITLTSVADPSVTCTVVVHVVEAIRISDVLNGTWVYGTTWKVIFTPEASGATKGTVEITNTTKTGVKTAVYTYEYLTDGLQITYVSGDQMNVKLAVNKDFKIKVGAYTMKRPE